MDASITKALKTGWILLAVSLPLGLTLEVLHGFKVRGYLTSEVRREMWRLAHAHGTLLGLMCLAFAALAERHIASDDARRKVSRDLRIGAVTMPLGFFLGGILNYEGDPSLAIALVPIGGLFVIAALARAARNSR
jgi:hypothetical protein